MTAKRIQLRYEGRCSICGASVAPGSYASWDPDTKAVTGLECLDAPSTTPATEGPGSSHPALAAPLQSTAGASSRREFEKRHERRERRIEARFGKLAGAVKFLSDDPASTTSWKKGAAGEERLAAALETELRGAVALLHDRAVPGTRGNIDHLAVAPSGVWVIDAKSYTGKVERRDVGGLFKTDVRLFVNGRDRTELVDGMSWQVEAVRSALGAADVPVTPALCFVGAEWPLLAKPFQANGVWVLWRRRLVQMLSAPRILEDTRIATLAERLGIALPAKLA